MLRAARGLGLAAALLLPAGSVRGEFVASEADFRCLADGVKVPGRNFRIFHADPGRLAEAVAMVEDGDVRTGLPEGTILQLITGEAMVKRGGSFNPLGSGWEFFRLRVTLAGATRIVARGGAEVLNVRDASCQGCHRDRAGGQDLVAGMTADSGLLASLLFQWAQENDRRCR